MNGFFNECLATLAKCKILGYNYQNKHRSLLIHGDYVVVILQGTTILAFLLLWNKSSDNWKKYPQIKNLAAFLNLNFFNLTYTRICTVSNIESSLMYSLPNFMSSLMWSHFNFQTQWIIAWVKNKTHITCDHISSWLKVTKLKWSLNITSLLKLS